MIWVKAVGNNQRCGGTGRRCRAQNIVMQAVGCTREEAAQALRETGGEAKTAVVKLLLDVDAESAQELLERSGGKVRQALAAYRCGKEAQAF